MFRQIEPYKLDTGIDMEIKSLAVLLGLSLVLLVITPATYADRWSDFRDDTVGSNSVFGKAEKEARRAREKAEEEARRIKEQAEENYGRAESQTKTNIRNLRDDVEIIDKVIKETERAGRKSEDAVKAVGKYVDRSVRGTRDAYEEAFETARSGNLVDAWYAISIQPLKNKEEYVSRAVQESSYLNTIATTTASVYGGPGGAAAYAAWYTYKQTGDLDLAVKTGVITGATSAAMGKISEMPSSKWEQKALLAGAVGGAAIAASGGDSDDVWDGFLNAGGMVLIQDGYKEYTGGELTGKHSIGSGYCMGSAINPDPTNPNPSCLPPKKSWIYNENGDVVDIDITKTDLRRPHVGLWSEVKQGDDFWGFHERSGVMETASGIPGMNHMSVAHDKFAADYALGTVGKVASIPPFVALTYMGLGAPTYGLITKTNIQEYRNSDSQASVEAIQEVVAASDENRAQATFVCTQSDMTRTIVLDAPSSHPDYACRVIYQSEKGLTVLWNAKNDANFCKSHATEFVAEQVGWGWACLIQAAHTDT